MSVLVMKSVFGSTLYGTDTPESDMDYKGIYLPDSKSILLGTAKDHYSENTASQHVKNTSNDVDITMYSLKYFMEMAMKGETFTIDMIHTPSELIVDYDYIDPWDFIYKNRSRLYTTDMKAYLQYVKTQAARYGIKGSKVASLKLVWNAVKDLQESYTMSLEELMKTEDLFTAPKHVSLTKSVKLSDVTSKLPVTDHCFFTECKKTGFKFYSVNGSKYQLSISLTEFKHKIKAAWEKSGERARLAERNEGIDWKALHHVVRGSMQLLEIYSTGDLKYPLAHRNVLLDIKQGKLQYKAVSELIEDLISDVDKAAETAGKNGMRKEVDRDFWNAFVIHEYKDLINGKHGRV